MAIVRVGFIGILAVSVMARPAEPDEFPVVSRWSHPDGYDRPATRRYQPAAPASFSYLPITVPGDLQMTVSGGGRICLMIHTGLWAAAEAQLITLQNDLYAAGYTPVTMIYNGGSAEDVRSQLQMLYQQPDTLCGALLIGDLPYIVFEMIEDWDGDGPGVPLYADFPCDLYFMDLDGEWSDSRDNGMVQAGNGKYDNHTGDTDIEIWVGRIKTGNLPALGDETALLQAYLDKNHRFRSGHLTPARSALVYNDDDWACLAAGDTMKLGWIYGASNVTRVAERETTTADHYLTTCSTGLFESITVRSHGYSGGHGFFRENRSIKDDVRQHDYATLNPRALFYSLFVCSGCDFSTPDNLAGTISFNPNDSGLLCWGSTKTGGMFNEAAFYDELADRQSAGAAFVRWYNDVHQRYDAEIRERWFYGLALIGDASLAPTAHTPEPQAGLLVLTSFCIAAYRRHRHAHASRV